MKKAITLARNSQSVNVIIAEDTDIFVLLIYHWTAGTAPIYMQREFVKPKREQSKYSNEKACDKLCRAEKDSILFCHAWSGCYTTSASYGQGKAQIFKKLPRLQSFRNWQES